MWTHPFYLIDDYKANPKALLYLSRMLREKDEFCLIFYLGPQKII